uniref:PAT complex subunit CCDC47 n=1 Tax=Eubosmina coregoni TaxID=186181 RepID=A0A4Y7LLA7_9CRUS|nr:EOG090X08PA [Eubosmina coregoni]SVE69887.1 EOG090X08PA [Eubosmina coregoni]
MAGSRGTLPWMTLTALAILFVSHHIANAGINHVDVEDNEFAEFESDFDIEEPAIATEQKKVQEVENEPDLVAQEIEDEEEVTIETEDNEFEHVDDDEYEGYDKESSSKPDLKLNEGPKITFAQLPAHLRSNWESYYLELMILAGLVLYFVNFFIGRSKNQKIAETWYATFKPLLSSEFQLVGDDGKLENSQPGLMKESENVYLLWCSGRTACEAVLFELRLIKRQDLVSLITGIFRPQLDQVHVKVFMNETDMDTYVMCLANKKSAARLAREMADISTFCPDRKSVIERYGLPANFQLMSEIGEASNALLDPRVCAVINKIPEVVESIHVSDQYSGPKQPEDGGTPSKMPDIRKITIFTFNLVLKNGKSISEVVESTRPALQLAFYCTDRVKRFRLSKEGRARADKNRMKVEEAFLKSTHLARAEAAAARREEKRRQEKEKILAEDDPEKQRKWEEKENKRLAKKRQPKMKAIKV